MVKSREVPLEVHRLALRCHAVEAASLGDEGAEWGEVGLAESR
jgi:hypothetical protein